MVSGATPGAPRTLTQAPSTPNSVRFRPVGANRAARVAPFLPAWAYPARAPPGRARIKRGLKLVSCVSVMQAGTLGRPACAMHVDRRRPTFRPQPWEILAGQMIQDSLDHAQRHSGFASFRWRGKSQSLHCLRWRIFDTGDDLDRAPATRASLHIDLENPLEALRPAHR